MSEQPVRVQRRRTKGWRKPDNCVIVSRPSRWGNPCKIALMQEMGYVDPHFAAAENFRTWLSGSRFDAPDGCCRPAPRPDPDRPAAAAGSGPGLHLPPGPGLPRRRAVTPGEHACR